MIPMVLALSLLLTTSATALPILSGSVSEVDFVSDASVSLTGPGWQLNSGYSGVHIDPVAMTNGSGVTVGLFPWRFTVGGQSYGEPFDPTPHGALHFTHGPIPFPPVGAASDPIRFTMTGHVDLGPGFDLTGQGWASIAWFSPGITEFCDPCFSIRLAYVFDDPPVRTPEPATWLLVGLGLLALTAYPRTR